MLDGFDLKKFSFVPDYIIDGRLIRYVIEAQSNTQRYWGGCFWPKKGKYK